MCTVATPSVVYLGHRIDSQGLHQTSGKLQALRGAPSPTNVTELKSFLGLLNYYDKLVPYLASMLARLFELLKTPTLQVDGATGQSIQSRKRALSTLSVLVILPKEAECSHLLRISAWSGCGISPHDAK